MKIVIVGGVAGGASAAAHARRVSEDAEIVILERGEHVSFANCGLPYHLGGIIPARDALLLKTPQDFKTRFNIDVRVRHDVVDIDPINKTLTVRDLLQETLYTEHWDKLLLSTGAAPIVPPLPGLDLPGVFTLRNIHDMDRIIAWIATHSPRHATIVGGGFIGLEVMEALSEKGMTVSVLEMGSQVMAPLDPEMAVSVHQEIRRHGVDLRLNTALKSVSHHGEELQIGLSDGQTLETGMVILAIGVKPESALAKAAGIATSDKGGIRVNSQMQTTITDIYAVGDVVETQDIVTGTAGLLPLAGPANRQGRIAADNMLGRTRHYQGSQGTAICKVFSLHVGSTGQNEKQLAARKILAEKIYVHGASHASYYPNATPITLKLLFDPQAGQLLGAQVIGQDGVDKRIDVLAVALRAGLTVTDLEHLELAYAPPFNSARDIINQAGMLASNILNGDTAICQASDVIHRDDAHQCLLDIRTASELETLGQYPDALHIPLDELRQNLHRLPHDKEILIGCQSGLRGHVAWCLLQAHGFRARNLTGGYKTWQAASSLEK